MDHHGRSHQHRRCRGVAGVLSELRVPAALTVMATVIINEGMMIDLANSGSITQTCATALDTAVAAITNVATARIDIVSAERRKPGRRLRRKV
jgi:hypothetical protein